MCALEAPMWNDFVRLNIIWDVNFIHFVEEGDDIFYVTPYNEDGLEQHRYEPGSAQFWCNLVPVQIHLF